jgi:hypothetical protein
LIPIKRKSSTEMVCRMARHMLSARAQMAADDMARLAAQPARPRERKRPGYPRALAVGMLIAVSGCGGAIDDDHQTIASAGSAGSAGEPSAGGAGGYEPYTGGSAGEGTGGDTYYGGASAGGIGEEWDGGGYAGETQIDAGADDSDGGDSDEPAEPGT